MTYATSKATDSKLADDHSLYTRPACLIEGLSPAQRDQRRIQALTDFNLLGSLGSKGDIAGSTQSVSIFDEATQTVSQLLAMPICMLSVVDAKMQYLKSVVGLSSLGLMNQLAATRSIPRDESFCIHVIDSGKTFAVENATAHLAFSRSFLVHQYGIQSYLGVPLFTTEGCCIGTLAVMDLLPHSFTQQEIISLELTARWCMSEFEKQHMHAKLQQGTHPLQHEVQDISSEDSLLSKINQVRFDLIVQLTQDLRNPLMSVTGMANMLSREIYGPLSQKQQEYAKIVLGSSQQLLTMVDEIIEVGDLEEGDYQLAIATVDIEMIAQQAIASLSNLAQQQDLQIKLTIEPGSRIWNLDKRVVKQLIYHLIFSIIKMSTAGSTIRLHVSRKDAASISLALWVSNPWLGEDLPQAVIAWGARDASADLVDGSKARLAKQLSSATAYPFIEHIVENATPAEFSAQDVQSNSEEVFAALATAQKVDASRQELGLLLSRHLTEIHGGSAQVQGSSANGHRYIITLPALAVSL
ncbi:MAG: GAF domain-containing protein [Phormidesmis sp.]